MGSGRVWGVMRGDGVEGMRVGGEWNRVECETVRLCREYESVWRVGECVECVECVGSARVCGKCESVESVRVCRECGKSVLECGECKSV